MWVGFFMTLPIAFGLRASVKKMLQSGKKISLAIRQTYLLVMCGTGIFFKKFLAYNNEKKVQSQNSLSPISY